MEINIRNEFGWKLYKDSDMHLWFSGYLTGKTTIKDIILESVAFSHDANLNIEILSKWVNNISGHFALIIQFHNESCFLAVDKICSIPIFDVIKESRYAVSNYAPYLKKMFDMDDSDISLERLLEISMSGFTIGDKTIYHDINRLMAGECVFWKDKIRHNNYYYTYFPCRNSLCDYNKLKSEFTRTCLTAIKKLIKSVNGRQIVVPLSAGNDSRLIASCLKELSYKNVLCFTYGRLGNYEVNTSKKVAEALGYKWIHIPDILRRKRAFFKSTVYDDYINTFESYASVPNIQDVYEIYTLKNTNIIDDDAVFVNGSTGDFISGGHIPKKLKLHKEFSLKSSSEWSLFLDKHYSLWGKLRTNFNDEIIVSQLNRIVAARFKSKKKDKILLYTIIEGMEWLGRQSRLVINQQRSYDYIGHEWRLPFWSEEFLNFWEGVPPEYKVGQKLYKDVLMENNWGGAWKGIEVNNKQISPQSLRVARFFVKALMSPFGKRRWHLIEKKVFVYWMHPSYARAVTSYLNVLFDKRGQRNTNSWTADNFIKRNGYLDGVIQVSDKIKLRESNKVN